MDNLHETPKIESNSGFGASKKNNNFTTPYFSFDFVLEFFYILFYKKYFLLRNIVPENFFTAAKKDTLQAGDPILSQNRCGISW